MTSGDDIAETVRDRAVPLPELRSVGGEPPLDPLPARLRDWLDGPEIVGLGEATHGTRECFTAKSRLIQYLVTERGFRTVAFEADVAAVTAIDEYVQGGRVTVDSALEELDMWQWKTESVRDLFAWLRTYNTDRPAGDRVRVRGIDLSVPSAPARPIRRYLNRVAPTTTESDAMRTLVHAEVPQTDEERDRALDEVAAAADTIRDQLEANRVAYVAQTSEDAWAEARQFCRVVEQHCEWHRVRHEHDGPHPAGMATRDRLMAENVEWALEAEAGAGVVVWAHDGHVQRGTFDDGTLWNDATTMGERLDREFGSRYRALGFDFARGAFRAVDAQCGEVETFATDEPLSGTATERFAVLDSSFFLGFENAEFPARGSWLDSKRATRYVGSVFDPTANEGVGNGYARTNLSASFDGLLFLDTSSPTRPLDDG